MTTTIDLSPLYRSSVGFDYLSSLLDSAFHNTSSSNGYPPYNIEVLEDETQYRITLAVAGFSQEELTIETEKGILKVRGQKKDEDKNTQHYLYQGIAQRNFERKFQLAEHVKVTSADLQNGLLEIRLVKEIPEAMKPKTIPIGSAGQVIENRSSKAA